MKLSSRLITAFFIFLMILLSILFLRLPSQQKTPLPLEKKIIQESMKGVQAQRFDQDGKLIQVATMESWFHYKDDPTSQMRFPTLKIFHQDGSMWDICADKGESFQAQINGKLEKLKLSENVVVQQLGGTNFFWWELKTQHLLFFVKNPMAFTEDPVIVKGPDLLIRANGIRAYFDRQYLEFIKDVETRYEKSPYS